MSPSTEPLKSDLKALVRRLAEQGDHDHALAELAAASSSLDEVEVARLQAYVLALKGDYVESLASRETILRSGQARHGDYFQAAYCAMSAKSFRRAEELFSELARLEEDAGEHYFKASAYFLLAYAQMRLGKKHVALDSVGKAVAVHAEVSWPISGREVWDAKRLTREIESS